MDHGKEYIEIAISSEIDPLSWSILKPDLSLPSVTMQAINSNSSVLVGLGLEAGSNPSSREMPQ